MTLYLASTSPRRRELLRHLGIKHRLLRPAVCEEELAARQRHLGPLRFTRAVARAKAESVAAQIRCGLIVGVDTIVAVDRTILGKPQNKADARRMLRLLSGRLHRVVTSVAVVRRPDNLVMVGTESTRVEFRRLAQHEIERYVATDEPDDKAGAYGIQGRAGLFVSRLNGCYPNVVGLPVRLLLGLLERAGYRPSG